MQLLSSSLPGWEFENRGSDPCSCTQQFPAASLWHSPFAISASLTEPDTYLLCADQAAQFLVSFPRKRIVICAVDKTANEATIEHLLGDQLVPRIVSHLGGLVLHAGAVNIQGGAVLFLGETGQGKSTLSASFHQIGNPILSDDAVLIRQGNAGFVARAIVPSLRLFPGAVERIFDDEPVCTAMAGYSDKVRVHLPSLAGSAPVTLALGAIFFIAPETVGTEIEIRSLPPAQTCINILQNSFAFDPSDRGRAQGRMEQAAQLAENVAAYELTYPRDFRFLPRVRTAILECLQAN